MRPAHPVTVAMATNQLLSVRLGGHAGAGEASARQLGSRQRDSDEAKLKASSWPPHNGHVVAARDEVTSNGIQTAHRTVKSAANSPRARPSVLTLTGRSARRRFQLEGER
ncbi:hypothetical protein AAFF_G00305260 [Aldrovandia affinis]|uniref:Uncharacterized protein n=1 Tax=Aldrovandia affinis TaxID=143900 RepID=A0AAD7SPD0_9TELE|nr:hypothetical protein AAFF_G00305260 [Aldrovandia affinis]